MKVSGEGVLDLFNNDTKLMLRWAFGVNSSVILKMNSILTTMIKKSRSTTSFNLTSQEAHAQSAMIIRRLMDLEEREAAMIFGAYDREKRNMASGIIYKHVHRDYGNGILQKGVMELMIREYLGNKGLKVREYAVASGCSMGKASETRTKLFDILDIYEKSAIFHVENLFYEPEEAKIA